MDRSWLTPNTLYRPETSQKTKEDTILGRVHIFSIEKVSGLLSWLEGQPT